MATPWTSARRALPALDDVAEEISMRVRRDDADRGGNEKCQSFGQSLALLESRDFFSPMELSRRSVFLATEACAFLSSTIPGRSRLVDQRIGVVGQGALCGGPA
ncbi:hypothetical protein E4U35_001346 [Claviceps purpurea]|nr:hypothetical protein E4U35_001346 [Claviceps purpurea]